MQEIGALLKLVSEYGIDKVFAGVALFMWYKETSNHNATRDRWAATLEKKITSELELKGTIDGLIRLLENISRNPRP